MSAQKGENPEVLARVPQVSRIKTSSRVAPFLVLLSALALASCTSLSNWAFGPPEDGQKPASQLRATPVDSKLQEAPSGNWYDYGSDKYGVSYYADAAGIMRPTATTALVWLRRVFPAGAFQKEIISREEVDCNRQRHRTTQVQGLYWDGRQQTSKNPSPWSRFNEDTPDGSFLRDACTGG